jgi:putative FmdB family regulatory protein
MPVYEYACRACGRSFDRMRPMAERLSAPPCPSCNATETVLRLSTPGMVGTRSADAAGPCGQPAGTCCGGACAHTH